MKKKFVNPTKVITGVQTRWSYANVWTPKAMAEGAKPKYSVSLIIPKSDTVTIQKIKAAIKAAYEEGQLKLKGNGKSVPPLAAIKTPLRDGDVERPDDSHSNPVIPLCCIPIICQRWEQWMTVYGEGLSLFRSMQRSAEKVI